jgi:hypothetical protein
MAAKYRSMTYDQVQSIIEKYNKEIDEVIHRFKEETGMDVCKIDSYDNGKPTSTGDIVSYRIIPF